jgi:hypothetical protein
MNQKNTHSHQNYIWFLIIEVIPYYLTLLFFSAEGSGTVLDSAQHLALRASQALWTKQYSIRCPDGCSSTLTVEVSSMMGRHQQRRCFCS